MKIHCAFDELVDIGKLHFHPKNPNQHSKEQIDRLAKILDYQGWRRPIVISKRSGLMTAGHGRVAAAMVNKWTQVPVNYQDYEDEDMEIADLVADNAIAEWAELDLAKINTFVPDLSPEFDIDMFGLKDFVIEPADKNFDPGTIDDQGKLDEKKPIECPNCGHKFTT